MPALAALQAFIMGVNVLDVKKDIRFKLFLRCLFGGIGMPCLFLGLKFIPASKATLIVNIHPMLVSIAAYFVLNEKLTKVKILGVIGAFIGVALFSHHKNLIPGEKDEYFIGVALASIACICTTGVAVTLRMINQHIHFVMSPFWIGVTNVCESLLLLALLPSVYNFSNYTVFSAG